MYVAFAYLCLGLAFLVFAIAPQSVAGFYYHGKMLAVVHLVTLGWITCSILGVFYLICPIALRTVLTPGKLYHVEIKASRPIMAYADGDYYKLGYAYYEGLQVDRVTGVQAQVEGDLIVA